MRNSIYILCIFISIVMYLYTLWQVTNGFYKKAKKNLDNNEKNTIVCIKIADKGVNIFSFCGEKLRADSA